MTDKIIIDGVDVAGCEFFDNQPEHFCNKDATEYGCGVCDYNHNCLYKRFQRTQQQYNQVVEQNKSLQQEVLESKNRELTLSLQKIELEKECEKLETKLKKVS